MISCDFDYYRPTSLIQALQLHQDLSSQGKNPIYYSGGTEIITMARGNQMTTGAVIDVKGIPECNVHEISDGKLFIGATVTLNQIEEANYFPLLSKTSRGIADHTSRNHITLGGNICGKIKYREAILPFLLSDSQVKIVALNGEKTVSLQSVFDGMLQLHQGELLTQIITEDQYLTLPFVSLRKVKQVYIDYPLMTVAALKKNQQIRAAFSGICEFPFRSNRIEDALNNTNAAIENRIEHALSQLPAPILNDQQGSAQYRQFVLRNTLYETFQALEEYK